MVKSLSLKIKLKKAQGGFVPVLIVLILVILGVIGYVGYTNYYKVNKGLIGTGYPIPYPYGSAGNIGTPSPSGSPLPIVITQPQISWIQPVRVANLGVFKTQREVDKLLADSFGGPPDLSKFYFAKVADLSDGSILINGYAPRVAYYGVNYIRFIVKGGSVKAILDGVGYYPDDAVRILSPNIPVEDGRIDGINTPGTLIANGIQLYNSFPTFEEFTSLTFPVKLADTISGPLYVVYDHTVAQSPLFDRFIYLGLKDGTVVRYSLSNISGRYDNRVQKFTLNSGGANDIAFISTPFWGGCGGESDSSTQVIKAADIDTIQKEVVGKDANGNTVYKITDANLDILKTAYKQYSDSHSGNTGETMVSYDNFVKDNNNILTKDAFGDWVFYLNPKYAQLAECGKPVIYLYPTEKENVSVQVGANITNSDPEYPPNGWNVVAYPDGKIYFNGTNYPYLFWEGFGNGFYPNVESRGIIVRKENVESQIRQDLAKLGLNEKETFDFLDFWLPKMPSNPYIKLTWLNTFEMNQLAPLSVLPKPDTMIRVFLDFKGYDEPAKLEPQKFYAPKRNGFTLVEWGGLLIH